MPNKLWSTRGLLWENTKNVKSSTIQFCRWAARTRLEIFRFRDTVRSSLQRWLKRVAKEYVDWLDIEVVEKEKPVTEKFDGKIWLDELD